MLSALSISNIVLIERLDMELEEGFSVFTGETGAGKSILLDALGLALGARGDASLVRAGARQGQVRAIFHLPPGHPVFALLEGEGLEIDGTGEITLRRVQGSDGKARAQVNGQPVSVALLRQVGSMLVEIHGQHDSRALVDASRHGPLLDAFAGLEEERRAVGEKWRAWRRAADELAEARRQLEETGREGEWLAHVVAELDELAPREGEEEQLAERRQVMMHAQQFADALEGMEATLSADGSLAGRLNGSLRRIERLREAAGGLLDDVCEAFDRVLVELAEAESLLGETRHRFDFDQRELEETEERLFALRAAARKHKVMVDELPALAETLRSRLRALEDGGQRIAALEQAENTAREEYFTAARALSGRRRAAARELDERVAAELAPLKLEKARFTTGVESADELAGASGIDRVEFMVATNPGSPMGPLARVASGGELARFMLALKVALAERGSAPVLVFDEIDTGVGGAVAAAMGERLARLAAGGLQVLAVTHSPQVAAAAAHHHVISKHSAGGLTQTSVRSLDEAARREEIARMLSAHDITDEARAQARRLLKRE